MPRAAADPSGSSERARRGTARDPTSKGPAARARSSRFVQVMIGTIALNGTPATARSTRRRRRARCRARRCCVAGACREPREELARVLHVARAVEAEETFRRAVPARVALERLVAGRREELRRERLHVLVAAAEPVEEHHGGPAAGGCVPVGRHDRAGELGAVRNRDRQLLGRRGRRGGTPEERGTSTARTMTRRPTTGDRVALLYDQRHGHAADRGVRLGRGRAHRPARVPRHDAARGFRLSRRPRAPPVRPAAARRGARVRARDRPLPRERRT